MNPMVKVAIVDDHALVRQAFVRLIQSLNYKIVFEADQGKAMIDRLKDHEHPEIVLMDVHMPEMDGFATTRWLQENFPNIKVIALTMSDDENIIMRMLRNGARGYILKDVMPRELKLAIDAVVANKFCYPEMTKERFLKSTLGAEDTAGNNALPAMSEKEIFFLQLATSEMTYKQIAFEMNLSQSVFDGYRDSIFQKFGVKSRTGLVLFATTNGIVQLGGFSAKV